MTTDEYTVTEKERARYSAFGKHTAIELFQRAPKTLWYYTSGTTFARILKSNSVWATQISCLNDHTEFRYSVRLLRDEFKGLMNHEDEERRWLASYLYQTMENDGADSSF